MRKTGRGAVTDSGFLLRGWLIVISLAMPVVLFITVIASVSLGVFAAYAAVICILNAFGRKSRPQPDGRPRLTLVPTQHHASGD